MQSIYKQLTSSRTDKRRRDKTRQDNIRINIPKTMCFQLCNLNIFTRLSLLLGKTKLHKTTDRRSIRLQDSHKQCVTSGWLHISYSSPGTFLCWIRSERPNALNSNCLCQSGFPRPKTHIQGAKTGIEVSLSFESPRVALV